MSRSTGAISSASSFTLRAVAHPFERVLPSLQLSVAENEDMLGLQLVCQPHGTFQTSRFKVQSTANALLPQVTGQQGCFLKSSLSQGRQEKLRRRQLCLLSRLLQHQQDALKPQGKAKTLGRRTAQRLRESVVSSSAYQAYSVRLALHS